VRFNYEITISEHASIAGLASASCTANELAYNDAVTNQFSYAFALPTFTAWISRRRLGY